MLKVITHRPLWLNILIGVVLAIGLFLLFILSLNWLTHHNQAKTVPNVTGKSYDEAVRILESAGFEVEVQDSIYTDTTRPHTVLKQVPESDEVVKVNRTVFITINRAVPPMVEMPNLVGYSFRNAEMTLVNAGLKVGDTTFKPDFAKGSVLEQLYKGSSIAPGTKVPMGTRISFVLGTGVGNQEFSVPVLVGLTYGQAKSLLEENGLVVGATPAMPGETITDTLNAFVGKQNPERFDEEKKLQKIRTGQTIDLWLQVSKPVKDSVDVPLPE
jgi:beta-lactam-binding protein with PASTA domain